MKRIVRIMLSIPLFLICLGLQIIVGIAVTISFILSTIIFFVIDGKFDEFQWEWYIWAITFFISPFIELYFNKKVNKY